MTTDMITLRDADSLNVIQKPEFKKIKFHPVSYEKIKSKWLKSLGLEKTSKTNDDVDKLAVIGADLCALLSNVSRGVEQDRAIKLKDYMFRGVYTNAENFYAKEDRQVLGDTTSLEEVVTRKTDSVEVPDVQHESMVSETIPSVQETVASLDLQEIRGAVDQAFARADDTSKDDEVAKVEVSSVDSTDIESSNKEDNLTKVVKNPNGKAKVEKFSSNASYHLNHDNIMLSPVVSSVNDDIFGKRNSETVMERVVPIVAAARDVSMKEHEEDKLFNFSEKDNVAAPQNEKVIGDDTTSKKMADLGRLYDEFNQEATIGQSLDKVEENGNIGISELDKVKEARKKLLEVLKLKEEQDRKTREAAEAAEAAEAERLAIVQKALETAENERKTLEASLNASKEQEKQNREKAARENQVIQELSAMFQGTPVNFVIPTKKTVARGGK